MLSAFSTTAVSHHCSVKRSSLTSNASSSLIWFFVTCTYFVLPGTLKLAFFNHHDYNYDDGVISNNNHNNNKNNHNNNCYNNNYSNDNLKIILLY